MNNEDAKMNSAGKDGVGAVMVVGAGIAGIQSALDLADSGYKVYLVEKKPAIGGTMPQLDKTFPTNDCSMCILSPKLVECGRHLNIDILTNSDVLAIEGEPGNFQVKVKKAPRYIDLTRCTGCGECPEACPVVYSNEFEEGLNERKAVYRLYPQAFPNAFSIDKRGKSPCRKACPGEVNAHGYIALISQGRHKDAISLIRETLPFPGIIGRICPHPCELACKRGEQDQPISICGLKRFVADQVGDDFSIPSITKRDEKIAVIGSGPAGLSCAYYLAINGFQVTIFEALPVAGGMLKVGIPDYRLPQNILDEEIGIVKKLGVEIKTSTPIGKDLSIDDLFQKGYKPGSLDQVLLDQYCK